jgi:hypothetical protein
MVAEEWCGEQRASNNIIYWSAPPTGMRRTNYRSARRPRRCSPSHVHADGLLIRLGGLGILWWSTETVVIEIYRSQIIQMY